MLVAPRGQSARVNPASDRVRADSQQRGGLADPKCRHRHHHTFANTSFKASLSWQERSCPALCGRICETTSTSGGSRRLPPRPPRLRVHRDAAGKTVKSLPKDLRAEPSDLRAVLKELKPAQAAERSRLEQAIVHERTWHWREVTEYFLDHPVTGPYARSLVWRIAGGPAALPVKTADGWELAGHRPVGTGRPPPRGNWPATAPPPTPWQACGTRSTRPPTRWRRGATIFSRGVYASRSSRGRRGDAVGDPNEF
ncbi:hypothetical protein GCM10017600_76240 [Streptosporangium carneum]|uniref:DUF4132 domain-containing protein n=1 Tax=Streptosporangium carneum TaxID=47481 RepID=A0A9W6I9E3_9ACTN|nr:hypothetical protein GCM10017600_76240 [Streptosporangium carneum]